MPVKSAVKANISIFYLHQSRSSEVNYRKDFFVLYARFFGALSRKEMIRFNCYFSSIPLLGKILYNIVDSWFQIKKNALGWTKLLIVIIHFSLVTNYNFLMIFRSEWTKLKNTLNLVRCFLLHSTKFQYFFMDSKVNCQIHMITDTFKIIWKKYFKKEFYACHFIV